MTDPAETLEAPTGLAAVFGPTINAIFAPGRAFDALAARPLLAIWPLIWITLLAVLAGWLNVDLTIQTMRVGMIEGMQQRGQEIDPERLREMLGNMERFAPVLASVGNVFLVVMVAVIAALFWIGASLTGGSTRFSKAFGVAVIGAVITPLLSVWFVTLMWKLNPPEFRRMAEFFASTPSLGLDLVFGSSEMSTAMRTVLQRCDLFNVWWIIVSALGCERLLNIRGAGRWAVPITVWALGVVVAATWASFSAG